MPILIKNNDTTCHYIGIFTSLSNLEGYLSQLKVGDIFITYGFTLKLTSYSFESASIVLTIKEWDGNDIQDDGYDNFIVLESSVSSYYK